MKIQIVFAFIVAVVFACGGNGEKTNDSKNSSTAKTTQDALAAGKKAYQMCTACHGPDGKLAINGAKDFAESCLLELVRVK